VNDPTAQAALDRALDGDDSLTLVYQPIHDARTGAIWSAEALLRQRRADGELREASIITEAAEESPGPELFALDSMLVKRAYSDAARWDVRLNVNLSPREFEEGDVLKRLTSILTSCGIDRRKVNLEITETSYIERPEETMDVLSAIKELGVSLWLDDFGTGHSSLTHLQHFPVDGIKLPGDFVRYLPGDERCAAIVRSLIGLAHDLGIGVVAEEVETREQLDFLLDLNCEWIQGFLFSKPMTADVFADWLGKVGKEEKGKG
jgi:diguanylate cyclase